MQYMKRKRFLGCIITACILVLNGSEWEGSIWEGNAVVAPNGDLPAEGLYVATNVFPRNTVVYITNLETEKTIPVTVAASLNNPGLLIALTREAAEAIGMPIGALGRIKMIQPTDPEAFSKYLAQIAQNKARVASDEALQSSGQGEGTGDSTLPEKPSPVSEDPSSIGSSPPYTGPKEDASPKDAIGIPDAYKPGAPSEFRMDERTNPDPEILVLHTAEPVSPGMNHPDVTAFPETAEEPRVHINDKPEERLEQMETYLPDSVNTKGSESGGIAEASGSARGEEISLSLPPQERGDLAEETEAADNGALTIGEKPALEESFVTPQTNVPLQISSVATEDTSLNMLEKPNTEEVANLKETEVLEGPRYNTEEYPYSLRLTPAEERPPIDRETIKLPAEAEIASIDNASPQDRSIDPNSIVNAIALPEADSSESRELAPIIPSIPPSARSAGSPLTFSVPMIRRLEKGKYYLQLRAYHRAELVEPELSRIGTSYPLTIENSGSPDQPLYRILLGPMNQGESGALLQRFRGIGYHDAFLRFGT
ncbi:MAG: hypothetical protein LBD93_03155 [Treponema sp.]|nr:hypothetical protein [Treponema sp.]